MLSMDFISFSVTNAREDVMEYCLEDRKADIIIEKVYNMGNTIICVHES